ncbi:MAG: NAD(+)/NADH kinase [Bdellovibrionia bacterium]
MKNLKSKKLSLKSNNKIALVYRLRTQQAVNLAKELAQWLQHQNYQVYTAPEQKIVPGTKALTKNSELSKMGLVIVLGGDGTYLRAVRLLEGRQVPILGFNMGNLGFLTAHNADDTFKVVEATLKGQMKTCPRSMLRAEIRKNGKARLQVDALNDLVIERGPHSQLINLAIYSERFLVSEVKADGFIISSPSGSTAYNLAAGGPIMHPEAKAFVITPVAPHSLTSRPLIFPDDRNLEFRLEGTAKAQLIVDGQKMADIQKDDEVVVSRSPYDHWIVRALDHNFFHLLREKLRFGDR